MPQAAEDVESTPISIPQSQSPLPSIPIPSIPLPSIPLPSVPIPSIPIPTIPPTTQYIESSSSDIVVPESNTTVIVPEGRLVRLYYENFHSAHPILIPAGLYDKTKAAACLHQVVTFIGSHYSLVMSNDTLHEATWLAVSSVEERTPATVQALLLYSIIMRARNEITRAESCLTQAIDIAVELGMHRDGFAVAAASSEHEAESLRRTWWELFIWEVQLATVQEGIPLRCSQLFSDVLLPCEETTYASPSSQTIPPPQSLASFRARIFTEEEEDEEGGESKEKKKSSRYSSFAYRIEAARILARVLVLNRLPETHQDHLQAVANALVSWMHHLPECKLDIVDMFGTIDEMLFQAHYTIRYAAMLLHLPRSNLRPRLPESPFAICPRTPVRLSPSLTRQVHDIKTVEASKQLSNLFSMRSGAQGTSPLAVCGLMLCGLVQLAAAERHGAECLDHHQNRLVLVLGYLRILRSKWALAHEAYARLRATAAQTAATATSEYSPFESRSTPTQANPLPLAEDEMNEAVSWSNLFSEYIDPTCGDSLSLYLNPERNYM
ncbi:hypothetical protein ASPZODRAFT_127948 [Penicilliopsis zonata CBS 506.65]|uniref:Xylanolytic transcriptional activator regulatory domain-containing protein n=1 Tax=Penicilliopsis zonata CBS 506.65 TaxID=1073090 RepID=A0A1L9SXF8_9EURO|nr:hypothetical protein ASPZODRAFT_127948 [Penicilliopsis zonata CBS 506.65]OJJ51817.1 hypothetical protein ASPZODRAFT_127948 [Penicilliopsis zonata CBS 506.65]